MNILTIMMLHVCNKNMKQRIHKLYLKSDK